MKTVLLKILKIFMILAVLALAVFLVLGSVLYLDWPWWVGLFILCGLIGLALTGLFLRKIWLRRREQQFVEQIIEQDESRLQSLAKKDKEYSKELQDRWREAIEMLRRSHLKKRGNPLYVLPWYLVVGESGSGKTTAIQSARLSSPFTEVSKISGISGTKNCDWWFFEQAIVIDTAGRYAIPVDEGRDKDEWQKFLQLLVKYRKKEPINGLIVSVAADKLLEASPEKLQDDGRNIRRRINELMLVLGAKFPVYVLVTKCDLIQGMAQFCDKLPESSLDQAMGSVNVDLSSDVVRFEDDVMSNLGDRLRDLRLLLLHHSDSKVSDPGVVLFPEEFEKLETGLQAFITAGFQENPFQETPILRGIYFSSGRQEGTPYSHFLNALGLIGEQEVLPGTNKGLFLHDFFSRILPKDRSLFAPTQRWIEWRNLTTSLGLTAWIAIALALCGLLTFSFFKNLKILRDFSHVFATPPSLSGQLLSDFSTMEQLRDATLQMEQRNTGWWAPRLGLDQSEEAEVAVKNTYCDLFRKTFLVEFDEQLKDDIDKLAQSTPPGVVERYVVHLVRRIDLLSARIQGEPLERLVEKPPIAYWLPHGVRDQQASPDPVKEFNALYPYYLIWRLDTDHLEQENNVLVQQRDLLLSYLVQLVNSRLGFYWLVPWVNGQKSLTHFTLNDFWTGRRSVPEEKITVAPAFTLKGKQLIDEFIKQIQSVLSNSADLRAQKNEFYGWYGKSYLGAWSEFAGVFSKGIGKLGSSQTEWQQTASKIGTDQGPYWALLKTLASQLEPVTDSEDLPAWVKLVYQFEASLEPTPNEETPKKVGLMDKLSAKKDEILGRAEEKWNKVAGHFWKDSLGRGLDPIVCQDYQKAMVDARQAYASNKRAYDLAAQVFKDESDLLSPFARAYADIDKLKGTATSSGAEAGTFWELLRGPVDLLWIFTIWETACYLQEQWEIDVLRMAQESAGLEGVEKTLLGQESYAKKFITGAAEPFVTWSVKEGYHAKKALNGSIPFEPSFFAFFEKGAALNIKLAQEKREQEKERQEERDNYPVTIEGLPTDVNPEATIKPKATILEMHCSNGGQTLKNYHFPIRELFNWSPKICSDVVLQILVKDFVLTKTYSGDNGFPDFLRDFRSGQHTFRTRDFPGQREKLEGLGISHIVVKYRFRGNGAILGRPSAAPIKQEAPREIVKIPKVIVKCWSR